MRYRTRLVYVMALVTCALVVASGANRAMAAQEIEGVVDNIRYGDTFRVKLEEGWRLEERYKKCSRVYSTMAWIQLLGVDTPDGKKACSGDAAFFTRQAVFGKRVKLKIHTCGDAWGLAGVVEYDDMGETKTLNFELVRAGLATLTGGRLGFSGENTIKKYNDALEEAKIDQLGLWESKPCSTTATK